MLIVPKEKPVVEKLNSYYLHIKKLFEHYQGELGCGAIHFKSPFAEGVIYFDKDEMLNGFFREDGNTMKGKEAVEHIVEAVDSYNFTISIHQIPAEYIYLWANVPDSEEVYKNLSTEFTELGGLVKKMKDEKLTGFINVIMRDGISGGMIFFNGGQVVGGSFSWRPPSAGDIEQGIEELIEKCKEAGATFYVGKIIPQTERLSLEPQQVTQKNSWHVITALEELLGIFEEVVRSNGTPGKDFRTLLKKKFLSKANKYDFLDPFAGEFEYADRKITFVGEATDKDLARGVIESVKELAKELKVSPKLLEALGPWYQQNKKALTRFGIRLF